VAALVASLLVLAIGLVVHLGLLWHQLHTPTGIPTRYDAKNDSAANVQFRRRGLKAAFVGADGRVSTSKTQVFLWTVFLIAAFIYLLVLTRSYSGGTLFSSAVSTNWRPEYLVLIGLPVAAATIAAGTVKGSNGGVGPVATSDATKIANATDGATAADIGVTSLSASAAKALMTTSRLYARDPVPENVNGVVTGLVELVTDDSGALAWPDLQYVVFTLIALVSFCAQILASPKDGLPPVPAALLTLMGVSSAGYVANKVVSTQGTVPSAS